MADGASQRNSAKNSRQIPQETKFDSTDREAAGARMEETRIRRIPVTQLKLDPENPRLPEGMDGSISENIIKYYRDNYVLNELEKSLVENGYFEQEPMVVMPDGDKFVVLEGNRRLASLIQLLHLPGSIPDGLADELTAELRDGLLDVPCLIVQSREEVSSYLGFRHIGGLKPWPPEAKARFLSKEVRRLHAAKTPGNYFAAVARSIGTNSQSVKLSFSAFELLVFARDELGLDVSKVASERFGVWLRCLSSKGVVGYISFAAPDTVEEFNASLKSINREHLAEVISDLTPREGVAILADSRDVTVYGNILQNDDAKSVLRESRDIRAAEQFVAGTSMAEKIQVIIRRMEALKKEAEGLQQKDDESYEAAKRLFSHSKTLVAILNPKEID